MYKRASGTAVVVLLSLLSQPTRARATAPAPGGGQGDPTREPQPPEAAVREHAFSRVYASTS
jgi:hypothetical protein